MVRSLAFSALTLFALAAAAHAQSSADSFAAMDYSFSLDANSQQYANDIRIDDQGVQTYNLIVPYNSTPGADNSAYFSPYYAYSGNGSAYAEVDPGTYFDLADQSGFAGVDSYAQRNPDGTADASVGTQETMVIYNNSSADVTYNVLASATATGNASASAGSTARVDTYVGIDSFDISTGINENPLIHIFGPAGAVVTTTSAEWTSVGGDSYTADYSFVIKAGTARTLAFYTSTINRTAAVPEPASLAALGLGAAAMLRRRKRA